MKCCICGMDIKKGELVKFLVTAVYNGPTDDDLEYYMSDREPMHDRCQERTENVSDELSDKDMVKRSDALSLFS